MTTLHLEKEHGVTVAKRRTAESLLEGGGPYAKVLLELVAIAKEKGASDIHIEPNDSGVDLRIRVDGEISSLRKVSREHRESLILEAKRVFGLAIGISGRPQDERIALDRLKLDLRVSLLPTHYGEKIVLRLLNRDADFDLGALGFLAEERKALESALTLENGVVVLSGPTGSGKTKTLYALLQALGPKRLNIVTLEDPIEYRIDGLNQVQVSEKLTFADALRSVLRQDPDVILVGEVRDRETAKLCFQAAETGHLVFTTLHANGAKQVVERLEGLGVGRLVLASNLRLSIAQRLEPKLCQGCAKSAGQAISEWFAMHDRRRRPNPQGLKIRGEGCSLCALGIRGRVPVMEWATLEGADLAIKLHQTLDEARKFRALKGEIDCREVMR